MASTVEVGDGFRDTVAALLRTQFPDVATEQSIGGTKVDITFTERHWLKTEVCAVECKNYGVPLTKADFETIFNKYYPMVKQNLIHRILVISNRPIGAAAEGYLAIIPEFTHLTLDRLAEELFDIRRVVENLRGAGKSRSTLYIEPRFEDQDQPAFTEIEAWIGSPGSPALAILGGYGQGKTSLAEQVAASAAERYLSDPTNRIPILIRLGEVVHETQLEGLFGKEFTAKHHVPKYRFDTLMRLNELGRLLIILDGFDEMKHAMSAHDFEANFREFNRLLVGDAKVMLLGRPNALPSEERELVFKGYKRLGDSVIKSPLYTPWLEWRLSFFEPKEAEELLFQTLLAASNGEKSNDSLQQRTKDVMDHVPHDLLKRPVHVVLIAEAAADPNFDFEGFNEYMLYSHFVTEMVKRDQIGKRARRDIPLQERLIFQRDLAWWAWARPGVSQGHFYRDEVPSELLIERPDGGATDSDGKRNEYIVSTLTDEKESGVLYFSHRSFQEFLVAERMTLVSNLSSHSHYSRFLNPEIANFISLSPDREFLNKWHSTLNERVGPLGLSYLSLFAKSKDFVESLWKNLKDGTAVSASTLTILMIAFATGTMPKESISSYQRLLRDEIEEGSESSAAVAAMSYLSLFSSQQKDLVVLCELVASIIVRALNFSEANRVASQQPSAEILIPTTSQDIFTRWIEAGLTRDSRKADRVLVWHPNSANMQSNLWDLIQARVEDNLLLPFHMDDGWARAELPQILDISTPNEIAVPANLVLQHIPKQARNTYSKFLNAPARNFKIVGIDRRGAGSGRRQVAAAYSTRSV